MTIKTNSNILWSCILSFSLLFGACNSNAPQTTTSNTIVRSLDASLSTAEFYEESYSPTTAAVPSYARPVVAPPIVGVDVPYQNYQVNTEEGKEMTTSNGSRITIPANAFVDKNGNLVKGDVAVRYREFHNASEIIASGIPMHNPDNGAYMQTAGMFEIRGEKNGEELFLASNKSVQIDMASKVGGNDFNFYQLGSKDNRWQDKGTKPVKANQRKLSCLRQLDAELEAAKSKPTFVKSTQTNNFVFDLELDYQRQPELSAFKNVVWEYTGEGPNPEENEWVFSSQVRWDGVDIQPLDNGYYQMVFTSPYKIFSTTVRPVLSDKDYDKALVDFNKKTRAAYNIAKVKQAAIRQAAESQWDLMRSFSVNNFGIYNWDIWKDPIRQRCNLKPSFDQLAQKAFEETGRRQVSYFLVSDDNRSVVRFSDKDLGSFSYNPQQINTLIAILPNGQAALAKNTAFKTFQKERNKENWNLELETTGKVVRSVADIQKLVNG